MGLTTRKHQSELVAQDAPHYYMVYIENQVFGANTRCCGTRKDLEMVLNLYPGSRWEEVYPPNLPGTVNVQATDLGKEESLQEAAKALPESQAIELEL